MGRLQDKRHEKQRGGGGAAASGVFLSFMEMVLGSRVSPPPSLLGSETDGGGGDAVSQSCMRGPWKTRRERHRDAIAQELMD